MRSAAQLRKSPLGPMPFVIHSAQTMFTLECRPERLDPKSLLYSLAAHLLIFISPWPVWHHPVAIRQKVPSQSRELTTLYSPALPNLSTSPATARNAGSSAAGAMTHSRQETIRIASDSLPVPISVDLRSLDSIAPQDLASILAVRGNGARLGAQAVVIASGRKTVPAAAPPVLRSVGVPVEMPKLPLPAATVTMREVPEIAGSHDAPAPAAMSQISGTANLPVVGASPTKVELIRSISGGTNSLSAQSTPEPVPSLKWNAPSDLSGLLSTASDVRVVNPNGGTRIGGAPATSAGRVVAAPAGTPDGLGMGTKGTGAGRKGADGKALVTGNAPAGGNLSGTGGEGVGKDLRSSEGAIDVSNGAINLDSFAPKSTVRADRSEQRGRRAAVVIVSSRAAGGALQAFSGVLKGEIYTIYLNASGVPAVMQYSATAAEARTMFGPDLTAPEVIYSGLPTALRSVHQVIAAVLGEDGRLTRVRSLDTAFADSAPQFEQALSTWRFRPAYRGDVPVEVNVLLGFQIDTN